MDDHGNERGRKSFNRLSLSRLGNPIFVVYSRRLLWHPRQMKYIPKFGTSEAREKDNESIKLNEKRVDESKS